MKLCSMLCDRLDGRMVLGETGYMYMYAKSLHCPSETITTLLICYIPIQMVLVLKKIKKHSLKNIYFLSLPLALFTICECMCISHLIM